MVRIAVAGGSGNVGQEIIDGLVARKKHEVHILSRKDAPESDLAPGVKWVKTSYENVADLVEIFQGVHTVLSFVDEWANAESTVQKNLIDASIQAGVKRFAPSEWASASFDHMYWYNYKERTRKYLTEVNKDRKVLEYTLFHPGLFTNYFTYPFSSSKHLRLFDLAIGFNQRRALVIDGDEETVMTLTTTRDTANIVALAIEYEGEWPLCGGIKGTDITLGQLIALGEKIRGGPFAVEKLKAEDLKAGIIKASWSPNFEHPSIPVETREGISSSLLCGFLLGVSAGNLKVSDAWNQLLPDYKFTQAEEFLTDAWAKIDAGAKSVYIED